IFALRGLVGASMFGGTHVPLQICEPRRLFLEMRDGTVKKKPPKAFADLEDNPYRKLAADLALRVRGWPNSVRFEGPNEPLWIKGPNAESYIDFVIARVVERAFRKIGCTWTPGQAMTEKLRSIAHNAICAIADEKSGAIDGQRGAI